MKLNTMILVLEEIVHFIKSAKINKVKIKAYYIP